MYRSARSASRSWMPSVALSVVSLSGPKTSSISPLREWSSVMA